ncbi:hypothetical protein Fot_03860 [Forsythia ovata]|uniref:Uncharacterized protein n=1 Tax=Forsythia ovata TaxID=205694 RepID=A0ABD1XAW7_9LAMI
MGDESNTMDSRGLSKTKRINIGSRRDELDPTVLEKLPTSTAIAVTFVRKYWTPTWVKAVDDADLSKLVKMTEMSTAQSHVLNCKLYMVLAENVDERSKVVGSEDVHKLRSKNKTLCSMLALAEEARA